MEQVLKPLGSLTPEPQSEPKTLYITTILFYKNKTSLLYMPLYINLQTDQCQIKSSNLAQADTTYNRLTKTKNKKTGHCLIPKSIIRKMFIYTL